MINKVNDLIKSKPYMVPSILLNNYKKMNLTDIELIILIYLINTDSTFNPKLMALNLGLSLKDLMDNITKLIEKDIIKIDIINNKLKEEHINLDSLYNKLSFIVVNDEIKEEKNNLFVAFEKEFGRTLSPLDYEIISDWQTEFTEELILLALKEAIFNGVNNLRYVDKIIRDWNKKGIKTEQDILNEKKKFQEKKSSKQLFDYDWLNERDN